jgi:DNA polymerase I-like protein with 3'-5' exonuclease and polymerase domains
MGTSTLKPLDLSTLSPPMNITLVTPDAGLPELSSFVAEKLATKGLVGLDTETNWCGDFYFRKVRTIQIGDKAKQFVIDLLPFAGSPERLSQSQGLYTLDPCYKPVFDILTPAICSNAVLKVGQNLSFEYMVFWWNFGQRMWHVFSTDLAERVIQAGNISLKRMTEFSMASIVARRFGLLVDKEQQDKFTLDGPLTTEMIAYAAFDTRMPLSMREHQLRELTTDQLLTTVQIENDAIGSFQDMHLTGQRIDCERWKKRIDAVTERRNAAFKILDETFVPVVGRKTEQIDFEELARREDNWRKGFELLTPEEATKADEIRSTRDNAKKAELRAQLKMLKDARLAKKADARKAYSELSKQNTRVKAALPKCAGEAFLNYDSHEQLLSALKQIKGLKSLESVADEHLLKFNDRPLIHLLRNFRKDGKTISTYGLQWTQTWVTKACKEEGFLHPWDGRLHCVYSQLEAETGRTSSSKPNAQNLPAEDDVRECFVTNPPDYLSPEGYDIITIDLEGCELRIIAELSNEPSWIKAFNSNQDVHSVSTEILESEKWKAGTEDGCAYFKLDAEGKPERQKCECKEHKKLRKNTKAINFLLCYGGGPDALADELGITVDAAKELMRQHEKAFPFVWKYLKEAGEQAQRLNEARDMYGRRRLLPAPTWETAKEYYKDEHADRLELSEEAQEKNIFNFKAAYLKDPTVDEKYKLTHREPSEAEVKSAMRGLWGSIGRRGKNHGVQGTNASLVKRAMGAGADASGKPYLWHVLPQYNAKLLSMVHDELQILSPKRHSKEVAELVSDAFLRAGAEVISKVKMTSEYHISDHWQK